jgi:DNA damage-binding protein 1
VTQHTHNVINLNERLRCVETRWRNFSNEQRTGECRNFIDGDLVESFLDLSSMQMQQVVDGDNHGTPLDVSVEEVARLVEIMVRIH